MERPLDCDCIVLAAGASRRMGVSKLYLPIGARTLIETTVANAREAGARVIIVARRDDGDIEALLGKEATIVRNPDPERGMLSSLREALGFVKSERFFFIPADLPFAGARTYRLLASRGTERPLIPSFGGRRGHPVLMPAALIPAILALRDEEPLKTLIEANHPLVVAVEDPGVLQDLDTPGDYREALAAYRPTCTPRVGA